MTLCCAASTVASYRPGPAGAPTRGMAGVLPTGRNFYSMDPRSIPSETSWQIGKQLADSLVERYMTDEGEYPESVGISVWGTSAMRTHGDDIAQILALVGVRPTWQEESRRVTGLEVIPLEELGTPANRRHRPYQRLLPRRIPEPDTDDGTDAFHNVALSG